MHNLNTGNYETARTHLKSVLIAAAIFCAMSALIPASLAIFKLACMLITVILFCITIYVICSECKCPHCGIIIFFGALRATSCPRCKRNLMTGKKQKKSR